MTLVLSGLGYLSYMLGNKFTSKRWGVRWSICVILGGLMAYTYLAMRLPGASIYVQKNGWVGIMGVVLIGALIGGGGAFAWSRFTMGSKKQSN
jgi:hypothetical protein